MRLSPMRQTTMHSCNSEFSLRDFFHFRLGGLRYHFAFDRTHSLQWYGGGGGGRQEAVGESADSHKFKHSKIFSQSSTIMT